jgi:hypothetical protein
MKHQGNGQMVAEEEGDTNVFVAVPSAAEEVAHVRARFAVDPSTPARLSDAWTSPTGTLEEDESEFLNAVADCLSVGLPVDAAVASWRSGTLELNKDESEDEDEDAETDVWDPHPPGTGRRLIIR